MKTWMTVIAAAQLVSIGVWLAQSAGMWPDGFWFAGWVVGLPGSIVGHWAAEHMLWMSASRWTIGSVGLALATLTNLVLAGVLGVACRWVWEMLKRRRGAYSSQE